MTKSISPRVNFSKATLKNGGGKSPTCRRAKGGTVIKVINKFVKVN
jgi:hypothetical protein